MAVVMLSSDEIELRPETMGTLKLVVKKDGATKEYSGVEVKLAFPMTGGSKMVSFREPGGKEIGLLKDADALDHESSQALQQALGLAYFVPVITKIHSIIEEFGVTRWKVETDRGPRTFDVATRQDVRPLGQGRYLIRDVDGNRYEIRDTEALDPASRSLLDFEI